MPHEFNGEKYEKSSRHQKEWGAKLISELDLKGDERVLDLGCGDGTHTATLARLVPSGKVIGIDSSKGMIDAALPKEKDNLRFFVMDINEIGFREEFDLVFSNAALHWVKDHRRLLKNVSSALKKKGVARFNFAGEGNCIHFFKIVQKAMAHSDFKQYFKDFVCPWFMPAVDEYTLLAEKSNLKEITVWGENADRFFPDVQALTDWIDQPSIVPLLAFVKQKHKIAFRNYVVEEMIKATRQDDGRCFETFRRINLWAKK